MSVHEVVLVIEKVQEVARNERLLTLYVTWMRRAHERAQRENGLADGGVPRSHGQRALGGGEPVENGPNGLLRTFPLVLKGILVMASQAKLEMQHRTQVTWPQVLDQMRVVPGLLLAGVVLVAYQLPDGRTQVQTQWYGDSQEQIEDFFQRSLHQTAQQHRQRYGRSRRAE